MLRRVCAETTKYGVTASACNLSGEYGMANGIIFVTFTQTKQEREKMDMYYRR
jgi:hypothetical protein